MLKPLVKVTEPTHFEIEVSWSATSAATEILTIAPIKLTRRVGFNCLCGLEV